jgi:hypothetical protein
MPSFVTYPQSASGVAWLNPSNATGNNLSTFATLTPSNTGFLYLYNLDNIDTPLTEPTRSITSISLELQVVASGTVATGQTLAVQLTNTGVSGMTSPLLAGACNTSASARTVNFYWDATGTRFSRRDIRDDSDFGVIVYAPQGYTGAIGVSRCKFTFNYEETDYLVGESSSFPLNADELPYVNNSTSPSVESTGSVITHDQLNALGDAIITLQQVALGNENTLAGLGPGNLYVGLDKSLSDITGNLYSVSVIVTGYNAPEYFGRSSYTINGNTWLSYSANSSTASALAFSQTPTLPIEDNLTEFLDLYHMSGMGWYLDSGVYKPLHVTPQVIYIANDGEKVGYHIGFSVLPGEITALAEPHNLSGTLLNQVNLPHMEKWPSSWPLSGNKYFEIRLHGFGKKVSY